MSHLSSSVDNLAFVDPCFLVTWARRTPRCCPLCKQSIVAILYNIQSSSSYLRSFRIWNVHAFDLLLIGHDVLLLASPIYDSFSPQGFGEVASAPCPTQTVDRRDLKILLESESVDFVTELVLGIIKAHSIESSASLDALRPFLHDAAPIFMRELQLFASSPFDMKAHDDLRKAIRQASCSSDQSILGALASNDSGSHLQITNLHPPPCHT
ncbi:uncharacterized protein BJ171DRAFT_634531 [Polychytrium aggregatum]|uniref:uncharacterized protein n=1 Tax=Polychytrium aggregatum TaxID=110093 RepID=UPI0022FEBB83|nr:uncharacterized protein BJ171DRAFT_634531 [Polychytrium aggregatum]KAI9197043.1 hypothetical protein BJ171DRAFT_634531 [Polychytrium aggregatum]